MAFLEILRQLRYPPEFRILAPPPWSGATKMLGALVANPSPRGAQPQSQPQLLADLGTGLWRLRQKMLKPGTTQPLEEMRKPYRHFESVWDALSQAGIAIHDYTDRPFDQGLSLKVIAYQPTPGLNRERIIETVKPSIYLQDTMIQMGEVIVGTPPSAP